MKGSPEKIASLCLSETLPFDYEQTLALYTQKGYRVIALAVRKLENLTFMQLQNISREKIEDKLTFLGFLIMENKLKEATRGVIKTLNDCKIRTLMATGDNTLTAISVGRGCNILDENEQVFFCEVNNGVLEWKSSTVLDDDNYDRKMSTESARANSFIQE